MIFIGETVTAALNTANTVANVVLAALPTTEERLMRIKLNEARILARSNRRATHLHKAQIFEKIRAIEHGLRIAYRFHLPVDTLKADLEKVVDEIGRL